MLLVETADGAKQMAAVIPLVQTPKWAKRDNLPLSCRIMPVAA
jgi:hypothetical protein